MKPVARLVSCAALASSLVAAMSVFSGCSSASEPLPAGQTFIGEYKLQTAAGSHGLISFDGHEFKLTIYGSGRTIDGTYTASRTAVTLVPYSTNRPIRWELGAATFATDADGGASSTKSKYLDGLPLSGRTSPADTPTDLKGGEGPGGGGSLLAESEAGVLTEGDGGLLSEPTCLLDDGECPDTAEIKNVVADPTKPSFEMSEMADALCGLLGVPCDGSTGTASGDTNKEPPTISEPTPAVPKETSPIESDDEDVGGSRNGEQPVDGNEVSYGGLKLKRQPKADSTPFSGCGGRFVPSPSLGVTYVKDRLDDMYRRSAAKGSSSREVKAAVIHATGTDNSSMRGAYDYWASGSETSAHYIIDPSGNIFATLPECAVAYHSPDDRVGGYGNRATIGIEHMGAPWGRSREHTKAQMNASHELIGDLCARHGLGCLRNRQGGDAPGALAGSSILRHRDLVATECPGEGWPVDGYAAAMRNAKARMAGSNSPSRKQPPSAYPSNPPSNQPSQPSKQPLPESEVVPPASSGGCALQGCQQRIASGGCAAAPAGVGKFNFMVCKPNSQFHVLSYMPGTPDPLQQLKRACDYVVVPPVEGLTIGTVNTVRRAGKRAIDCNGRDW